MINLSVVIDNDEALKKLRELQTVAKTTTSSVVSDSERMDAAMQKFKNTLMQVTAGIGMMQLAKQVATVRGEFQQLEVAFETMLGSKEKADKLMGEMIELAAKTPFGLQDVAGAAKMLLAYGSTAEEVGEEITMLGNIASGLSIPLNDLIYLYGTTRTQGQMFTQDLRQFMGRGIPIAEELAKQFGVATNEVGALVTAGKVGFEDVKVALEALTGEGGKFNDLMDKQSQTIDGQISAIQDSIQIMFNEIGKSSEGLINMTLDGVSWMVEHWRELLNILKYVVAVYGSYKAALILVAAAQRAMAIGKSAIAFIQLAASIRKASEAMTLLNTVTKASPLGLLAAVIGAVSVSFIDLGSSSEEAASGIDEVEDASDKAERTMGRLEQAAMSLRDKINELFSQILDPNTSTEQRMMLLAKLTELYPDLAKVIDLEAISTENLTKAQEEYNKAIEKELTLKAAKDRIAEAEAKQIKANTDRELALADIQKRDLISTTVRFTPAQGEADLYRSTSYKDVYYFEDGNALTTLTKSELTSLISDYASSYANDLLKEALRKLNEGEITKDEFSQELNQLQSKTEKYINDYLRGFYQIGASVSGSHYSEFKNYLGSQATITKLFTKIGDNIDAMSRYITATNDLALAKNEYEAGLKSINQIDPNYGVDVDNLNVIINDVKSYKEEIDKLKFDLEFAQKGLEDAIKADDSGRVSYWSEKVKTAEEAYDAMAKPYENYLKKQEKLMEEERKQREKIADMNRKLMDDAAQARVDAMEDGLEKELAQLDLNFGQEIRKIEEQEADLRKLNGGFLTKEQTEAFEALRKKTVTEYSDKVIVVLEDYEKPLKEAEASWDEYLAEYGTFQERLAAIKSNYDRKLADAKTEGEKAAIIRERDALLAEYEVEAKGFARNLADKTLSEIETITKQLQEEVTAKKEAYDALDSSDSDQAKALIAEIDILNAKIKALEKLTGKASDDLAKDKWEDATAVFQNITECANEAADGIAEFDEGLGNTLRSIAQLASSGLNLVVVINKITDAVWTGAEAISAMEKASVILAAISATIQVVSALYQVFKGDGEIEETTKKFAELNAELEQFRKLAQIDSVDGTIFGPNPFGNFINNLKAMQDALEDFEASKEAIRLKDATYKEELLGWNADGSAITMKVPQGRQNLNDAISNMQVMTKHKTWFTDREYEDLGNLYPELFDENGNVTLEGLQNLQNSDVWEKLGKKDRELIEQMIADWENYNAAVEATEKYLSDVFGDLGGDLTNALLDSFKNGTDAAEAFGEATGKILDRLASDIVNMALIQPIMDEAQEKVLELQQKLKDGDITYEEYLQQTKAVVDEAANKAKDRADDAYEMYEAAGIEENGSGPSSATSKGFQTMSQETGSELNGRFTDIQGQTHRIAEAVEFCKSLHIENLTQVQSINATVAMIHNDTSLIAQHTRALAQMRDDLASIRRSMDNGAI